LYVVFLDINDGATIRKKRQPAIRRRKLFGANNGNVLFEASNVPSTSSFNVGRTPIANTNKYVSNSNQSSPIIRPTISNISTRLEKSFDDEEKLGSDSEYSNEGGEEENTQEPGQDRELTSNMDDELQNLLNDQENVDFDTLQVHHKKLKAQCKRIKNELLVLKDKYAQLQQNTIREFIIFIFI